MIAQFQERALDPRALEMLLRLAVFKPAAELVRHLFQERADAIDGAYQPKAGWHRKGRQSLQVQCIFGSFALTRDYYHNPREGRGHCPADAALALEGSYTPALARLVALESMDEPSFEKAEKHLKETGGIDAPARQLQRFVQEIGPAAQAWQERQVPPEACDAPVMYVSGDGTGVPMRREELAGRKGKQEDGSSKTRQAYLGCVFTQHTRDEKGRPIRDHDSTSYIATFGNVEQLGLLLRWEARRRGSGTAKEIVLLLDGALGLENHGAINFPGCLQIVDFYHAVQHLKALAEALLGKDHPQIKARLSRWTKLCRGASKVSHWANKPSLCAIKLSLSRISLVFFSALGFRRVMEPFERSEKGAMERRNPSARRPTCRSGLSCSTFLGMKSIRSCFPVFALPLCAIFSRSSARNAFRRRKRPASLP